MDALDLLYVHWKNPFVSARRVMQSVRPLVEQGHVRRAGVSNFTLAQWREAEVALRAPVVANQVQFSLVSAGAGRGPRPVRRRGGPGGRGATRRWARGCSPAGRTGRDRSGSAARRG